MEDRSANPPKTPPVLTEDSLHGAARLLASLDPDLARIYDAYGPPPLWARPHGFATLVYIILEQQVSLASARAAYNRLVDALATITPQGFLSLDDAQLKAIGFSRQKTAYCRILAQAVLEVALDLEALPRMDDETVRAELTRIKGIGRWTADIYLMEALLRPDIWPSGDLALAVSVRRAKGLDAAPSPVELQAMGERYRPLRAVAARMFWHHYLSSPVKKNSGQESAGKSCQMED